MIVGLTGGIGSGKSTVAGMLAKRGAVVIDTDALAREVVQPPSPVLDAIRQHFGDGVIAPDGTLDRAALGRIVFYDEAKRRRLNELTHPAILKRVLALVGQQPANAVVVVVVPLLYESNFAENCQTVVAVVASPEIRRRRLMARDGLAPADIDARMRAQMDDADYCQKSALVLHNDGDVRQLEADVDSLWSRLRST